LKSPFVVEGARNVFLETFKHGEYNSFDNSVNLEHKDATSTVILRLYEAYGGDAQVKLVISDHLLVLQVLTTKLLADGIESLYILRGDGNGNNSNSSSSYRLRLDELPGFEVKTVKRVLGVPPPNASHKKVLVPFSFIRCRLGCFSLRCTFLFLT
jgi:alpha-mannosidase